MVEYMIIAFVCICVLALKVANADKKPEVDM